MSFIAKLFLWIIIAIVATHWHNAQLKSAEKKGKDKERQRTLDLDEEQAYSMNEQVHQETLE
jgi:hypothetical protein